MAPAWVVDDAMVAARIARSIKALEPLAEEVTAYDC